MATFLHLSDVHLGYNRYNNGERTKDFFYAFQDCIDRYALDQAVDFVLIVGDLFEHRSIQPSTLNQAQIVLEQLKTANIPVLAIEGNHDNCPYGVKTSWLRYLAEQDWLILLEPEETGDTLLSPWDPDSGRGGYIDLDCGVRVVGSRWYGASTPQAVKKLAQALETLPESPGTTVMMLHHGLEGQIARYAGALRYEDLLPLKTAGVDYLALGHIHKSYSEQGWIFNAGSVEANSVSEGQTQMPRGVYRVQITPSGIEADLKRDYQQRPIYRLILETDKNWSQAEVESQALGVIERANNQHPLQDTIVELRLQGQVGFNRLDLNLRNLNDRLKQVSGALIFLLKSELTSSDYLDPLVVENQLSREAIETSVFKDLLAGHHFYQNHLDHFSQGLSQLKEKLLEGEAPDALYTYVTDLRIKTIDA
ncbi:MAG: metallophosphoesterase [Prochlorotrichaceae cyanobacterium]